MQCRSLRRLTSFLPIPGGVGTFVASPSGYGFFSPEEYRLWLETAGLVRAG